MFVVRGEFVHMEWKTAAMGFPQGSALGSTLWNILLDDLLRLSLPWGGAYADDVTILVRYIFPGEGRGISLYSITTHRCVGID